MNDPVIPKGAPYKGPSGIARDSVWLTNEDLPHDRDVVVEIESVVRRNGVTFQGGRTKPVVLSLRFVGKERELALNATNRKVLNALFDTNECAAWFGKKVALYVQQDVRRPDGTVGPAVRIRAKRVKQDQPTSQTSDPRSELRELAPDLDDIDLMSDADVLSALAQIKQQGGK